MTETQTPEAIRPPVFYRTFGEARDDVAQRRKDVAAQMALGKVGAENGDSLDYDKMDYSRLTLSGDESEKRTKYLTMIKELDDRALELREVWEPEQARLRRAGLIALDDMTPDDKPVTGGGLPERLTFSEGAMLAMREFKEDGKYAKRTIAVGDLLGMTDLRFTATGASTEPLTTTDVAKLPLDQPAFWDRIQKVRVSNSRITYMALTTQTNAAAPRARRAATAPSTLTYVRKGLDVVSVAHDVAVPDELFEDEAYAVDSIAMDMRAMTLSAVNAQIVTGNGTSGAVSGLETDRTADGQLSASAKAAGTQIAVHIANAIGIVEDENQGGGPATSVLLNPRRFWDFASESTTGHLIFLPGMPTNPWGVADVIRDAAVGANDGWVLTLRPDNMHVGLRADADYEMSREAGWDTYETIARSRARLNLVVKRFKSYVKMTTLNT